jgi:hypothetical protein
VGTLQTRLVVHLLALLLLDHRLLCGVYRLLARLALLRVQRGLAKLGG